MSSFDDNIKQDKNNFNQRLLKSVFKYQNKNNVTDFESFKQAIQNEIGEANYIDEDSYIKLFEQPIVVDIIASNVGEKKTSELYKEKEIQIQKQPKKRISISFIQSKGYKTQKGKRVKGYSRSKPIKYTDDQEKFLKAIKPQIKAKRISIKEATTSYNHKFKDQPRTEKSLRSKIYRI